MVILQVHRNIVILNKSQAGYREFVSSFLVKFEPVSKIDRFKSTKTHKVLRTEKVRRNLFLEYKEYITFPRGLLSIIPSNEYTVENLVEGIGDFPINQDEIRHSLDCFDLRDDQVLAVTKSLVLKRGVVQLPTAVGKSAIISSTIKQILKHRPQTKILVLAPTLSTVKSINKTLINNSIDSQIFGHPNKKIQSPVTTALVQSLVNHSKEENDFLNEIEAVFYDECLPGSAQILLPDGSTAEIKDIYNNDKITEVMSYNLESGQYEIRRILRKFKTPFGAKFWKVYYEDPVTGKLEGITLTDNHKVHTSRGYVQAKDLTPQDSIKVDFPFARYMSHLTSATYIRVKRVSPNVGRSAPFKYNLEVEGNHNYFASRVLVSNCHHLKCDTWNQLNGLLKNVDVSLGYSALSIDKSEIYLSDIRNISYDTSLIVGCTGKVMMHMDPSYYIEKGIIALPMIFRVKHQVELPKDFDETSWSNLNKVGLMSESRSEKIVKTLQCFTKYHRKSLVLVSERDYAFKLGEVLAACGLTSFGISFGAGTGYLFKGYLPDNSPDYEEIDSLEVLDKLSRGEITVVIGTSHIDEGVDLNCLDCLVLSCGGKKDRRIIQRIGRVLRKSKTGKYAYVVDFTDEGSRVLSRQSRNRLSMYREIIGVSNTNLYESIDVNDIETIFKFLEGLI